MIKVKYPDVDHLDAKLPEWQKQLLNDRLDAIPPLHFSFALWPLAQQYHSIKQKYPLLNTI